MLPSYRSKEKPRHQTEDGYHSLSSSLWSPSHATPMLDPADGIYNSSLAHENAFFPNNSTMGRSNSPRDNFSPIDPILLGNYSNINKHPTPGYDGRGILIERIKVAQNSIDSLSAKVFFYENERAMLKEQKEQFEKSYYKVVQENSNLMNDKISKDTLLKKINTMGDDVSSLLKTQESLLEKHKDQQKNIEYYKSQFKLCEEENQVLKRVNEEMQTNTNRETVSLEKLKTSEEDLKNQAIVLKIEKETLSSELDRVLNKLKIQDERLRGRKDREQELIKENTLLIHDIRGKERELQSTEENLQYLHKQVSAVIDEKDGGVREAEREMMAAYEDVKKLQDALSASNLSFASEQEKVTKLQTDNETLRKEYTELKDKLNEAETTNVSLLARSKDFESQILECGNQNTLLQKENAALKQKLKMSKQEQTKLNEELKTKDVKMNTSLQASEKKMKELQGEMEDLRFDFENERDSLKHEHETKVLEIERSRSVADENMLKRQVELENMREHWTTLNDDFKSYKKEQEVCLSLKLREINGLQDANANLTEKGKNAESEIGILTEKLEKQSQQLQSTQEENNDLHFEYQERTKTIEKHLKTIVELESESELLRQKNSENLVLIDMLNKQSKSENLTQKTVYESKLSLLEGDYENVKIALRNAEHEKNLCIETYKRQISNLQKQSDCEVEKLVQERDEINSALQATILDVEEYKMKFQGVEKELEGVSTVNADLKHNLSLLSKELELYQQENHHSIQKDQEISELQNVVKTLRARELDLSTEIARKDTDVYNKDKQYEFLQQEVNSLRIDLSNKEKEHESKTQELNENIFNLTRAQKEFQLRNEKLKAECRKRVMQSHTTCGEMEMSKAECGNVKKELEIVVELNKKLEMVNDTLQEKNNNLKRNVDQLQNDMGLLKNSYEELLAKELTKQKSEFILKENQLLQRLSADRIDMMPSSSPCPPMVS